MSRKTFRFALALGLASAAFAGIPQRAAAGEDEGFTFHLDPADVGMLFIDVDTNSSKFEEYEDRREGVVVPEIHVFGQDAAGKRVFDLRGTDATREDSRWTLDYGQAGSYRLKVDFNQIVHRFGNGGTLIHANTAPGVYSMSDSSQAQLQGAVQAQRALDPSKVVYNPFLKNLMQPYVDAGSSIDLELQRERIDAGLEIAKMGPFGITADFDYENRQGNRPYGAAFGFGNVVELPEPIDYDTIGAGLTGAWNGDNAGVRFGFNWSHFENNVDTLLYDNPFRVSDSTDPSAYQAPGSASGGGPRYGANALAPDNDAWSLFANGRTDLGESAWLDGNVVYTTMTQDADLLPYSTNSAINPTSGAPFDVTDAGNLPVDSADAEAKTLQLALRAGVELGESFSITGRWRHYDYDNNTDRIDIPGYVRFDGVWEEIGRVTVPFGYSRWNGGIDLAWRFGRNSALRGAYEHRNMSRDYREVEDQDEDILRASLDLGSVEGLMIRASYEHGNRDISHSSDHAQGGEYLTEAQEESFNPPEGVNNQPGLRKYDEAARDYDSGRLLATWLASDQFELSAGFNGRKHDYKDKASNVWEGKDYGPTMGLISDEIWGFDAEVSWTPNSDLNLYAYATRTDRESYQRGRQSGGTLSTDAANNWDLTLEEITDTVGFGFNGKLGKDFTLNFNGIYTQADGDSLFYSPPGGTPGDASSFDEYDDNEFWSIGCKLYYAMNDHADFGVHYLYEKYTADRFARDGLQTYMPATLLLNANDGDYEAHLLGASVRIHF